MLLVEGNNDVFVCLSLLKQHKLVVEAVPQEIDKKVTSLTFSGNKFGIKNKDVVTNLLDIEFIKLDATTVCLISKILQKFNLFRIYKPNLVARQELGNQRQVGAEDRPDNRVAARHL